MSKAEQVIAVWILVTILVSAVTGAVSYRIGHRRGKAMPVFRPVRQVAVPESSSSPAVTLADIRRPGSIDYGRVTGPSAERKFS